MKLLGPIVKLQIQRGAMKRGEKPRRWYDPSQLVEAASLTVTERGSLARMDGAPIMDIHHMDHPGTKLNERSSNTVSVGFTSHHALMREHFGDHLRDGIAAETILVGCDHIVPFSEVAAGLHLRSRATGEFIPLIRMEVAHPCTEFSHFVLRKEPGTAEPSVLKATLQALDGGIRGFYATLGVEGPVTLEVGDEVWAE